ncbi:MAG TPA: SufD family Fe-S cluster assembly protein, partial [Opitutaceae bacterium]
MSSVPPSISASRSPIGSFTPDIFASHVASAAAAPAWWLERKRAAYEKFAALPLPKRTDESWRFSDILSLSLEGYALLGGGKTALPPLAVANAASLTFVNNVAIRGATSATKLPAGVIVTTIAQALASHPDLLRQHFMAQPQKLGSEKFAALPLPKRTDESWRFSDILSLSLEGYALLGGGKTALPPLAVVNAASLTFVNNVAIRGATSGSKLPAGVIVTTIAEALASHPDLLREHFMAQPQKLGSEKFAALHTAFVRDGAFIYVPKGIEVAEPILVQHIATGAGAAIFPHTLVIAEENAKVTVVDSFVSEGDGAHFSCGANDLYAGHGAQVTYIGTQNWSRDTLSFQSNSTVVRRDARVQSLNLHLGGRQARHESLSQLQAPGAFSEMLALTVADGDQEFDQRTLQIHQAPNTKSDLLYKNALRDTSKTIFSGLIVVDADAQKTDAYQSNRNLMLSENAEANSLPGLEIQANDVR